MLFGMIPAKRLPNTWLIGAGGAGSWSSGGSGAPWVTVTVEDPDSPDATAARTVTIAPVGTLMGAV
jgi:hypothetical protein